MARRAETRGFRAGTRWEHEIKRRARSLSSRLSSGGGRVRVKSFYPGADQPGGTPIVTTLSVRTSGWVREIRDGATAHHPRTRLFLFMYDPAGSRGAYIYMLATCALSVLHVVVWSLQESRLHAKYAGRSERAAAFFFVNCTLLCVFGVECLLRVVVYPIPHRVLCDSNFWIDLLSILPLCVAAPLVCPRPTRRPGTARIPSAADVARPVMPQVRSHLSRRLGRGGHRGRAHRLRAHRAARGARPTPTQNSSCSPALAVGPKPDAFPGPGHRRARGSWSWRP